MNLLPEIEKCAWECKECGSIERTNVSATSENTFVPCRDNNCAVPDRDNWKRRRDLETPLGKLKAQLKHRVGLRP